MPVSEFFLGSFFEEHPSRSSPLNFIFPGQKMGTFSNQINFDRNCFFFKYLFFFFCVLVIVIVIVPERHRIVPERQRRAPHCFRYSAYKKGTSSHRIV